MNDQSVIDAVRAELKRLGQGKAIHVSANAGIVTLSGQVRDSALKRVVAQEILRLPEVLEVRNELTVPPPPGDVRDQLRQLLAAEGVVADRITIATENGVVTLSGDAEGWFDRDAAERLAWTLPGVRKVVNDVRIPPEAPNPETAERTP